MMMHIVRLGRLRMTADMRENDQRSAVNVSDGNAEEQFQ